MTGRRYPVVYFLHGYGLTDQGYMGPGGIFDLSAAADRAFTSGGAREMISVTPNGYDRFGGSMYSSSVTTGDRETYIAEDLVSYIDSNFRTGLAAAWAPNPNNPPDYLDLPVVDGEPQPRVSALFQANSPLIMVPQYITSLKKYEAVAGDVGLSDALTSTNVELAELSESFGVHRLETYDGDHVNRVAERFEQIVLPFFSEVLRFED